jgi:hypothetical protein
MGQLHSTCTTPPCGPCSPDKTHLCTNQTTTSRRSRSRSRITPLWCPPCTAAAAAAAITPRRAVNCPYTGSLMTGGGLSFEWNSTPGRRSNNNTGVSRCHTTLSNPSRPPEEEEEEEEEEEATAAITTTTTTTRVSFHLPPRTPRRRRRSARCTRGPPPGLARRESREQREEAALPLPLRR